MATLVWIIVFLVVAALGYKTWQGFFGGLVRRYVPEPLAPDESTEKTDQYLWPIIAGILVATLVLHPISTIITLVLIAIIAFVVRFLIRFAMSKIHH